MADQDDVRRIALALPDTREAGDRFAFSVHNKGRQKGFVWAWNERVEPRKSRVPRSDVVAIRVAGQFDKEALLACDEEKFFTEPPLQPPPRIHQEHDEAFHILGGTFTFVLGTEELVVIPMGTRHGFSAGAGSRALLLVVPAGLEGFFRVGRGHRGRQVERGDA
jgi:quercetin dioxygenase-like cupin family protein